jgi:hypothetical protein
MPEENIMVVPGHRRWPAWRLLAAGLTVLLASVVALPAAATAASATAESAAAAPAVHSVTYTDLTLLHSWTTYPTTATPAVAVIDGIVHLRGAISNPSTTNSDVAFVLPKRFRPPKYVSVPVDMWQATPGQLDIAPDGETQVIAAGATSDGTQFTSLDGASFALSAARYTPLKLRRGWHYFDSFYRKPAAGLTGSIVHLSGEITTAGSKRTAFTLPRKFRPRKAVSILINVCTGSLGSLDISPTGVVKVEAAAWQFRCGTSLEGATFSLSGKSFTALKLGKGWKEAAGAATASVREISGIVRFRGAIRTSGTSADAFVLPARFRPATWVYVPLSPCGSANLRLNIGPDGQVAVQSDSTISHPGKCRVSLDGAWFAP